MRQTQPSASVIRNLDDAVYKWLQSKSDKFHEKLSDKHTEETLSQNSESLSDGISLQVIKNTASKIKGLFRYWCDSMKLLEPGSQPPWYDED